MPSPRELSDDGAVRWIRVAVILAVSGIFIYASISKILDPSLFALQLKYYKIYPLWSLHLIALLVPWWELIAGLALLIPPLRKGAALVLMGLILGFLVSVSQALARGLDIECGCFGSGSGKIGWLVLALDLALLSGTLWLLISPKRRSMVQDQPDATPAPA